MRRFVLVLLLGCSATKSDVERMMGPGASCVSGPDSAFLCTKFSKSYVCYSRSYGDDTVFCFEAVNARDLNE